jgi:S1-C subfamily serine protease
VVDGGGAVLGVTAARAGGTTSYVAPIDVVTKVTDDVLAAGHPRHSWLGIEGVDRTSGPGTGLGLVGGEDAGVVVSTVAPGGPCAAAGLEPSDVILAVDGQPVERMPDLVRWLRARSPGDVAELTVRRAGADTSVRVTLGELAAG